MKKLLFALCLATLCPCALFAACDDNATEKTWDKTASGYCKIFFPNCNSKDLGKRLSYSREGNVICVGEKGAYTDFYKVTVADANTTFKTEFEKMGVNYGSDLSKWLFDNCKSNCGEAKAEVKSDVKTEVKKTADEVKAEVKKTAEETKAEVKATADKVVSDAKDTADKAVADAQLAMTKSEAQTAAAAKKAEDKADAARMKATKEAHELKGGIEDSVK